MGGISYVMTIKVREQQEVNLCYQPTEFSNAYVQLKI